MQNDSQRNIKPSTVVDRSEDLGAEAHHVAVLLSLTTLEIELRKLGFRAFQFYEVGGS